MCFSVCVLSSGGIEGRQLLCACVSLGNSVAGDLAFACYCAVTVPHPGSDGCWPVFALR